MTSFFPRVRAAAVPDVWRVILLLLACCGACACAAGSVTFYTATQQFHTRKFLQSFVDTMPGLASNWTGTNFCNWDSVFCLQDGISVGSSNWPLIENTGGSLPELARGIDGSRVVITTISLGSNSLTGTLPASWARLSKLRSIGLSSNSLTGTVPRQWSELASLSTLDLASNSLSGTLPTMWSELTSITGLYLHNNAFSGPLPYAWADMPALGYLSAHSNQLSGTLPSRWSAMPSMKTLYFNNNLFTGSIPETWANISTLTSINIDGNKLCGCKPDGLTENFHGDPELLSPTCNTTNACPSDSSDAECDEAVTLLTAEQVEHTRNFLSAFTMSIPELEQHWSCPNFCSWKYITCTNKRSVEVIMPSDGLVGSLPEMPLGVNGTHVAVSLIDIGHNSQITGTLPTSWATLTSLKLLSVKFTRITGTLPPAWSGMTSLENLFIQNTAVSGTLPASWSALPALQTLYLNNNNLAGTLPASWAKLTTLEYLRLDSNQLASSVPAVWGSMPNITRAALGGNAFCGCLPSQWIALPVEVSANAALLSPDCATLNACEASASSSSVKSMSSSSSASSKKDCHERVPYYSEQQQRHTQRFFGLLQESIYGLSDAWECENFCAWDFVHCYPTHIELLMGSSDLFGTLPALTPDVDPHLIVVTKMDFSNNMEIQGTLPATWGTLSQVTDIILSGTMVNGQLPSEWSSMTSLKLFDAGYALLLSSIPSSWSKLKSLETLRINNQNTLYGSLPSSWGSMTSLVELDMSASAIQGTLPPSWSNLKNLSILSLSSNELSGTLPEEWTGMTNLSKLRLNSNKLTGSVPASYGGFRRMKVVALQKNKLCGCLPKEWLQGGVTYIADPPLIAANCATANSCTPLSSSSSSSGACNAPIPYYTGAQAAATLRVLNALRAAFAKQLGDLWVCLNPCAWQGVTCLESGMQLNLSGGGLTGKMPSVPAVNLSDIVIEYLDLSNNAGITGSLDYQWLILPNLMDFNIHGCSLSGQLPN
jgi:Leucine-rich repeat (LRR) protein